MKILEAIEIARAGRLIGRFATGQVYRLDDHGVLIKCFSFSNERAKLSTEDLNAEDWSEMQVYMGGSQHPFPVYTEKKP